MKGAPTFCSAAELPELQQFIARTWGERHILASDTGFLRWQFDGGRLREGADGPVSVLILRGRDGDIVAMQGLIASPFSHQGRSLQGAWLCNLMAEESERAQGAGLTMLRAVAQLPLDVLATAGINPQLFRLYPLMGFHTIAEVPRWVRVLDPERAVPVLGPCAEHAFGLQSGGATEPGRADPYPDFDQDWDAFWRGRSAGYFGVDRTARYMNWRYRDHPRFTYDCLVTREQGGIGAASVSRTETIANQDHRVTRVLELHGRPAALASNLAKLEEVARDRGSLFMDYFGGCAETDAALADAGWTANLGPEQQLPNLFQPLDARYRPLNVAVKVLRGAAVNQAAVRSMSVSRADGDQDRPNAPAS